MKIAFLSRYQKTLQRGAENFVSELSKRLSPDIDADIFADKDADDLSKVITGGYDIVIPVNGRLQSFKASLARLTGKYKLLITGHSGIGRDDSWNIAVCKPDIFVALTDRMADWAKKWAWGSRVVKIHNGIDLERFTPQGEKMNLGLPKPVILSAGALTWYKHHEKVIRAVKNGSVLIAGEGAEKAKLEKIGKNLLGDRFKIASFDYKDMPKVYRSADLFTLPSWDREAFGLVYLEAMACGLGVVAPDDESRREIIGSGGLLFTEEKNYAETLEKALNIKWKDKARAQAEKFSWDKAAKEYEKLMFDMIKA